MTWIFSSHSTAGSKTIKSCYAVSDFDGLLQSFKKKILVDVPSSSNIVDVTLKRKRREHAKRNMPLDDNKSRIARFRRPHLRLRDELEGNRFDRAEDDPM